MLLRFVYTKAILCVLFVLCRKFTSRKMTKKKFSRLWYYCKINNSWPNPITLQINRKQTNLTHFQRYTSIIAFKPNVSWYTFTIIVPKQRTTCSKSPLVNMAFVNFQRSFSFCSTQYYVVNGFDFTRKTRDGINCLK